MLVFEERLKAMVGEEYRKILESTLKWKSIRVNTLKIDRDKLRQKLEERFEIKDIPWYENGFFIRGDVSRTIEYYLGYYHIQESASMLPPLYMELSRENVLDLCASPGSKTTQMAMIMENRGVIFANDINVKRLRALVHNIQKSNAMNCIVINYDGKTLWKTGMKFDKILLDAPCTASGKIIRDKRLAEKWNFRRVIAMSNLQKMLLAGAHKCLKEDGLLVYSTCSLEPEENEEVVDFAVKKLNMEVEEFRVKGIKVRNGLREWNGKKFDECVRKATRIYPHDNMTEGFFICRLRKC